MKIFWSGLGIVVFLIIFVAILVAQAVSQALFGSATVTQRLVMWPLWGVTGGIANYIFARRIGVLTTTQGHTFFEIPVRYWTYIIPVCGAVGLIEAVVGRR